MWQYLLAFVMGMHGLAHISGLLGFWSSGEQAFDDKPWLFSQGITARSAAGRIFGLLWLVAGIGLVATALGLAFGQAWWPTTALTAAVLSLVVIVPWVRVVPPGAWAGACFDLLIVVALVSPWAAQIVEALT